MFPAAAAVDDDYASVVVVVVVVVVVAFCKCTRKTNRVEKQTIKQRRINKHTHICTHTREKIRNETKQNQNEIP